MVTQRDPELDAILARCAVDTAFAGRVLFPDNYYSPFSQLHEAMFNAIDSGHKKIVIAAPRGIGKTTIVRTVAAKAIVGQELNFVLYVSQSADLAGMQTENIKSELQTPIIHDIFGDIRIANYEGADSTFGKKSWVAYGNTLVLPRGAGQQVRGLNWRTHRPQLLLIDDLENKDEIANEDNRKKLKSWFFSDLLKCINRYKNDYRIIYIDTLKHEDSLLSLLLTLPDWYPIQLSICDENYKSNAPHYMTDEEIQVELEIHREAGTLDEFYREYMNIPISTEDAVFMSKYFRYYEESEEQLWKNPRIENVIIIDPAKSVKLHSAESAIVGIGFDRSNNKIYIRDLVAKKLYPDQLYDEAFSMAQRLKAKVLAVEVTGLNEFISYPFKTEITKRNLNIEFFELNARGKKEDRIAQLAPYYRKGMIFHNKTVTGPLEAQLLSFPRSKRLDCMDATAYFIELLEKAERYFYSDDDEEPTDDEAMPEDLAPALDNWRVI